MQLPVSPLELPPDRPVEPDAVPPPSVETASAWVVAFPFIAFPMALFYVCIVPAFNVADEPAHFLRAEQLTHGGMLGVSRWPSAGGMVDTGLVELLRQYQLEDSQFTHNVPEAWKVRWQRVTEYGHFPNTIRYPPLLYLPQVLGVAASKVLDLPVLAGLYLARLFNVLAMLLASLWALRLCQRGHGLLWLTLLVPMATQEIASCAQDAPIIVGMVATAALVSRGSSLSRRHYWILAAILAVCIAGRPPLVGFLLLLLLPVFSRNIGWRRQGIATALALSTIIFWFVISMRAGDAVMIPGVDVGQQLRGIMHSPLHFLQLAVDDLRTGYFGYSRGALGVLCWQIIWLPGFAYAAGFWALRLQSLVVLTHKTSLRGVDHLLVALAIAGCWLLMEMATYLTWDPVGAAQITGMQGRYFTPLLPLLALLIPYAKQLDQYGPSRLPRTVLFGSVSALGALLTVVCAAGGAHRLWTTFSLAATFTGMF